MIHEAVEFDTGDWVRVNHPLPNIGPMQIMVVVSSDACHYYVCAAGQTVQHQVRKESVRSIGG